jgi:hypothetical protein
MEIALWTQTRLLFLTWPNNAFFDTWKNRFQTQGIWLESYSRELVQEPCVVYVLLAPAQSHSYIGSPRLLETIKSSPPGNHTGSSSAVVTSPDFQEIIKKVSLGL